MPNDLYWLKDKGANLTWPDNNFEWDRPLIIGEYGDPGSIPIEERTSFTGESIYNFQLWRRTDVHGRDARQSDMFDYLKRATDVYRMQGVAVVNPWFGQGEDVMPVVAVRPVDFHPNFFSGSTGTRKVVVFNDTRSHFSGMTLQSWLEVDGKTVWEKVIRSQVEPGRNGVFEIVFECPDYAQTTKATLLVRLRADMMGRESQIGRAALHQETIYIVPQAKATAADTGGVILLDNTGATAKALEQLGARIPAQSLLNAAALAKATILIIGADTDAQPFRTVVDGFVRRGGRVIMLGQKYGIPLLSELAQTDDTHVATRTWKRSYGHPIVKDVQDAQLSYWKPDNIVSTLTVQKPVVGKSRAVIDAGGRFGLNWAPLLETPVGNGLVLQSQLNLVDRVAQEPLAGQLLLQMLRYSHTYESPVRPPLRVLVGNNDALKQVLAATSIVTSPSLAAVSGAAEGPVLLDSSYKLSTAEVQQLKDFVAAGGKIWLHGFNSTNIASVANLFPFKPVSSNLSTGITSSTRRSTTT